MAARSFSQDDQEHQHDDRVTSCGFHVKGEAWGARVRGSELWGFGEEGGLV